MRLDVNELNWQADMMGLALSTFVHRSDQAMIQKKLSDFAAKGKIRHLALVFSTTLHIVNMYYCLYVLCSMYIIFVIVSHS